MLVSHRLGILAPALTAGLFVGTVALLRPAALCAQDDSARGAGGTEARVLRHEAPLVAAAVARHLAALAADSALQSTDSAAPRLERGVRYVAAQFAALGLRPLGGAGSITGPYLQEYPVPGGRTLSYDSTALTIATFLRYRGVEVIEERNGEQEVRRLQLPLATGAPLVGGAVGEGRNGRHLGFTFGPMQRPVPVVLAGPYTPASAAMVQVRDKIVFYVPPAGLDSLTERAVVDTLARPGAGSRGVVVVTAEDSARFAARLRTARRPVPLVDAYLRAASIAPAWTVYVRAADSVAHLFALAGLDLSELQRAAVPLAREPLPLSAVILVPPLSPLRRPQLANVVGVVEGSDSTLKQQYVVVAAHLPPVDSGIDHRDLSGVAGVLALAEAFHQPAVRPRRSVLFAVTTGAVSSAARDTAVMAMSETERAYPGAEYLASKLLEQPGRVVAAFALDHVTGLGDSVALDGLRELDLGTPTDWVMAAHADSGLAVALGSVLAAPCGAHCAFLRRKMPSLYLHDVTVTGTGAGNAGARPGTTKAGASDPEHTVKALRLAFHLAQFIANADRSAAWTLDVLERLGGR